VWQAADMGASTADRSSPGGLSSDQLTAFIAELAAKSDLIWITTGDRPPQAAWHVWHDDAFAVVTGGTEQPDAGLTPGVTAVVTLRSKENRARQLQLQATVARVEPRTPEWDAAVAVLHPKRLNAQDGDKQPERWAQESAIWLLRPTGDPLEQPGTMPDQAHRAEPVATPATTLTRTPFHAGRATKKRR
jgi:hypothetical protein